MIGLTSETTDEVTFGRRDQQLLLCPQMEQVWYSTHVKQVIGPYNIKMALILRSLSTEGRCFTCLALILSDLAM